MDKSIIVATSKECKDLIERLDIVTPPIYESIFSKIAAKYGIDTGQLTKVTEESLDERIKELLELNEKNSEQIVHLDAASKKALNAMKEKNEKLLQESISETEALRREIEQLKESVHKDSLTKVWNRKWLEANILDQEERFKKDCTMAIVDLNYFKQINDTVGHIAGDKVLKYISSNLKKLGMPVVRYGGDEFLLIAEDKKEMKIAKKKIASCREELLNKNIKYNDYTFKVCFSYGIHNCTKGENFTDALEAADKKMYEDKAEIKKRVPPPF